MEKRHLEVIFKTCESCNNKCEYCFYFNKRNRHFLEKERYIVSLKTVAESIDFLSQGIKKLHINHLNIIFHGGEPLLQRFDDFDRMCSLFIEKLSLFKNLTLQFGLQTNGTLIESKWIKLFAKYDINPSISIDGPQDFHDFYRKDYTGLGTYKKVVKGIKLVKKAIREKKLSCMGTLTVINPIFSSEVIYQHFVNELNLCHMDFLLLDLNHDSFIEHQKTTNLKIEDYGRYLCELFNAWIKNDNPAIKIRIFSEIMGLLAGKKFACISDTGPAIPDGVLPVITIYYDGSLSPDDSFITTDPDIINTGFNINNISLEKFIKLPIFRTLLNIRKTPPEECLPCPWVSICNGGASINRYSKNCGFKNPSVYCKALKMLYICITKYMVNNGLPLDRLPDSVKKNLCSNIESLFEE